MKWALQTLLLALVIYAFVRFVQATRGSRFVRGLFFAFVLSVALLWGLSTGLQLEELEHILQGATGFLVVSLAIVFQPELRRAVAQLAEQSSFGRLIQSTGRDTVERVCRAARAMAGRRHGALIAFERGSSLNTYVETGTPIEAAVRVRLIESLFHPGGALHDGAVVIKQDRIRAAGCFFPLPQESDIDRSMGTRHRAAMGVTEETDAVVVVVSEETGAISLAQAGHIERIADPDLLEGRLRASLEGNASAGRAGRRSGGRLTWDVAALLISVASAFGILYLAHREIRTTNDFSVRIAGRAPEESRQPVENEIVVVLPDGNLRLAQPSEDTRLWIQVSGSRAQLDELAGGLAGVLEIPDADWTEGPLDLDEVQWAKQSLGMGFRWKDGRAPNLVIDRYGTSRVALTPDVLVIEDERINPRFECRRDEAVFAADTIEIRGPDPLLPQLGTPELPLRLEAVVLSDDDRSPREERLGLAPELLEQGFSLAPGKRVRVTVPIVPSRRTLETISREISLVCLAPDRADELGRWTLPDHSRTARFRVETSGLIPVDADTSAPAMIERIGLIKRFVLENLVVFVDVAELPPPGEGRSVPIRWTWRSPWRQSLGALGLEEESVGPHEELDVILESDPEILLEEKNPAPEGGGESSG